MASTAFGGTTQKCKVCEKTVYWVEQLTADSKVYHKACFRCSHCKGTLKFSNYSSIDGVLYCKPHYDQLLKMTGSLDKSFEGAVKTAKAERSNGHEANGRLSSVFVGTQEKCVVCKKKVYPIEKVAVNGNAYHRPCFKCSHGGCAISPSNYVAHDTKLYCKHHHSQLFMAKGNFSRLEDKQQDKQEVKHVEDDESTEKPVSNGNTTAKKRVANGNTTAEKTVANDNTTAEKPEAKGNATAKKPVANGNTSTEKPVTNGNTSAEKPVANGSASAEKPVTNGSASAEKPVANGNMTPENHVGNDNSESA